MYTRKSWLLLPATYHDNQSTKRTDVNWTAAYLKMNLSIALGYAHPRYLTLQLEIRNGYAMLVLVARNSGQSRNAESGVDVPFRGDRCDLNFQEVFVFLVTQNFTMPFCAPPSKTSSATSGCLVGDIPGLEERKFEAKCWRCCFQEDWNVVPDLLNIQ